MNILLWTLQNGKFDEKSTRTVEKIIDYYKLSPETVEKIYNENNVKITSTIYVDKDNEFEWPSITNHNSCGFCHALKTHIAILVDGTVVPCCLDNNGDVPLGNILAQGFDSILSSERTINILNGFKNRLCVEELCKKCEFKNKF